MPKPINPKIPNDISGFYEVNDDFRDYIDKYCTKHKINKETAFTHKLICKVFDMYHMEAITVTKITK